MTTLQQLVNQLIPMGITSRINFDQLSHTVPGRYYALLLHPITDGPCDVTHELVLKWLDPDSEDVLEYCNEYGELDVDEIETLSPKAQKIFEAIFEKLNEQLPEYTEALVNKLVDARMKKITKQIDELQILVKGSNSKANKDEASVEANKDDTPVEANKDDTPVEANKDEASVEANKDEASEEVKKDDAPVEANKTSKKK